MDPGSSIVRVNRNKTVRVFVPVFTMYFTIGFVYDMQGEIRSGQKYDRTPIQVLTDPYAYLRSALFAVFWPADVLADLHNRRINH